MDDLEPDLKPQQITPLAPCKSWGTASGGDEFIELERKEVGNRILKLPHRGDLMAKDSVSH